MKASVGHVLAVVLLGLSTDIVDARNRRWTENLSNFICTRNLPDGEVEKKVHWGKIFAIETSVEFQDLFDEEDTYKKQGLVLRQVTDGRHFIQLIYDSGWELRDCEYLRDSHTVSKFLREFLDCPHLSHPKSNTSCCGSEDYTNYTFELLHQRGREKITPEVSALIEYSNLKSQCHELHRKVRSLVRHQHLEHSTFLNRIKRDLFLYPGTNWCGSGSSARKFNELGYNAAADRCCRDHDHCPYTVEGFTHKYNFFNYRFHTISHCDCDERFRACLKLSTTAASNMVGKIFFNVVQTKCFLFKMEKVCEKKSWWGKCLKHEKQKRAILREALNY